MCRLEAGKARALERCNRCQNEYLKGVNAGEDEQEQLHDNLAEAIQDAMAA